MNIHAGVLAPGSQYTQAAGNLNLRNLRVYTNSATTATIASDLSVSGTITAGTKCFVIPHPIPSKTDTHRLRHWCIEGDQPGGSLIYKRQITAPKAGVTDLIMQSWFKYLATNVVVLCSGFRHHGTAWGEQDELDPCVIHVTTSRKGVYNVVVLADRCDECARFKCPQKVEYRVRPEIIEEKKKRSIKQDVV